MPCRTDEHGTSPAENPCLPVLNGGTATRATEDEIATDAHRRDAAGCFDAVLARRSQGCGTTIAEFLFAAMAFAARQWCRSAAALVRAPCACQSRFPRSAPIPVGRPRSRTLRPSMEQSKRLLRSLEAVARLLTTGLRERNRRPAACRPSPAADRAAAATRCAARATFALHEPAASERGRPSVAPNRLRYSRVAWRPSPRRRFGHKATSRRSESPPA